MQDFLFILGCYATALLAGVVGGELLLWLDRTISPKEELVTQQEALEALDKLDAYWAEPRHVRQDLGVKIQGDPHACCGVCFGVHVALALGVKPRHRGPEVLAQFTDGATAIYAITEAGGLQWDKAMDVFYSHSGLDVNGYPFGGSAWPVHPNECWPAISAELRARLNARLAGPPGGGRWRT